MDTSEHMLHTQKIIGIILMMFRVEALDVSIHDSHGIMVWSELCMRQQLIEYIAWCPKCYEWKIKMIFGLEKCIHGPGSCFISSAGSRLFWTWHKFKHSHHTSNSWYQQNQSCYLNEAGCQRVHRHYSDSTVISFSIIQNNCNQMIHKHYRSFRLRAVN